MRRFDFVSSFGLFLILINIYHVNSLPTGYDEATIQPDIKLDEVIDQSKDEGAVATTATLPTHTNNETIATPTEDLDTAGSEQKEQTLVGPVDNAETPDNAVAPSNIDPTAYGGYLTPEAFQQYINHFGAPYPYAAPPYPAPVYPGFVPPPPPIYPSPYVVETGYEGFLVPTTTAATTTTSTTTPSTTTNMMAPFTLLGNLMSAIMMSGIFRVLATIVSAVGMIFFGGAIMNFFCNHTPICDMSYKAVTYLRRRDTAERMGRMFVEEMTPERVRRAAEFVRNAISKYHELQQLMGDKKSNYTMTNNMR